MRRSGRLAPCSSQRRRLRPPRLREDSKASLELRCRADEAIAVVEQAAAVHGIEPGELVLGSDNGSAFTARRFRSKLGELGIKHRRGGYRDPES
jgi:putative transposase